MIIKQAFTLLAAVFLSTAAFSQYDTAAPYIKDKQLPNFTLLSIDSTTFDQTVLDKKKKTIFMLFNPECEHCQQQLELLISMPGIQQTAQILLSTTETLEKLRIFYKKYNLQQYPFIHPGKDTRYIFGKFFQPRTVPVLAFYSSKQQFVAIEQGNVSRKKVVKLLAISF